MSKAGSQHSKGPIIKYREGGGGERRGGGGGERRGGGGEGKFYLCISLLLLCLSFFTHFLRDISQLTVDTTLELQKSQSLVRQFYGGRTKDCAGY